MTSRLICFLFVAVFGFRSLDAQAVHPSSSLDVYLLAATPSASSSGGGFPSRLYRGMEQKLQLIRTVSPASSETGLVFSCADAFYVVSNSLSSPNIARVDKARPELEDTFSVSTGSGHPVLPMTTVVETEKHSQIVIPTILKKNNGEPADWVLVTNGGAGLSPGNISAKVYTNPFVTQSLAGPYNILLPLTAHNADMFSLTFMGRDLVALAPAIPEVMDKSITHRYALASNEEYLLAEPAYTGADVEAIMTASQSKAILFDRKSGKWEVLSIQGNSSKPKFFGAWIAWAVLQSGKGEKSPGRDSERVAEVKDLPDVADAYATLDGDPDASDSLSQPGILIADNPRKRLHVEIDTGQEDSEILDVTDDLIIYRVDDSIYLWRLEAGKQIGDSVLLVKDVDVPEVHWAFLSSIH